MVEPALVDLLRELDTPARRRAPELEVDLELDDDLMLDPWFQQTEAELAEVEDDPTAKIVEIRLRPYGTIF